MSGRFYSYKGFRIWKYDDECGKSVFNETSDMHYFESKARILIENIRNKRILGNERA